MILKSRISRELQCALLKDYPFLVFLILKKTLMPRVSYKAIEEDKDIYGDTISFTFLDI